MKNAKKNRLSREIIEQVVSISDIELILNFPIVTKNFLNFLKRTRERTASFQYILIPKELLIKGASNNLSAVKALINLLGVLTCKEYLKKIKYRCS